MFKKTRWYKRVTLGCRAGQTSEGVKYNAKCKRTSRRQKEQQRQGRGHEAGKNLAFKKPKEDPYGWNTASDSGPKWGWEDRPGPHQEGLVIYTSNLSV